MCISYLVQANKAASPITQVTQHQRPRRQKSHEDDTIPDDKEDQMISGIAPLLQEPSARDVAEIGPVVIDVTRLLQDSLHSAAARISDSDRRAERTTQRISLLIQLLSAETAEMERPGMF